VKRTSHLIFGNQDQSIAQHLKDTAKWGTVRTELAVTPCLPEERGGNGKEEIYPLGERINKNF
jgi:hypothetical protein